MTPAQHKVERYRELDEWAHEIEHDLSRLATQITLLHDEVRQGLRQLGDATRERDTLEALDRSLGALRARLQEVLQ